jgi:3-oxoacyl-[acyl-carrier protein] reductase
LDDDWNDNRNFSADIKFAGGENAKSMKLNLDNQTILVTGASRGIGLAITSRLLESGATVIAQYKNNGKNLDALRQRYKRCEAVQADLNFPGECAWLI